MVMAGLVLLQSSEAPGMCECENGYGTLARAPASISGSSGDGQVRAVGVFSGASMLMSAAYVILV